VTKCPHVRGDLVSAAAGLLLLALVLAMALLRKSRGGVSSMPDLGASDISWNCSTTRAATCGGKVEAPPRHGETHHQKLQRSLYDRRGGGPHEQCGSPPQRWRNTRTTEIVHSNMEEGLTCYKSLEPIRPHQPYNHRRYHLTHGIRVKDQDTVVVDSCDIHKKTKKGLLRESSGTVTYSDTHRRRVELDVIELAKILDGGIPGGGHAWTPRKLERIFRERTGRPGVWAQYEMPLKFFLQTFPKTFEQFGPDYQFARLRHHVTTSVLDVGEDAMRRLACARERGYIEQHPVVEGTVRVHSEELDELFETTGNSPKLQDLESKLRAKTPVLPALHEHRIKASFKARPQSSTY